MEKIANGVQEFLDKYLNLAFNFILALPWWGKALVVFVLVVVVIAGIIAIIGKTWKFLLVLAVLGGIGFLVYYLMKGKGGATTASSVISFAKLLKSII